MSIAGAIQRSSNTAPQGTSAAWTYSNTDHTVKLTTSSTANNSLWCNCPLLRGSKYYWEVAANTVNASTTTYMGVAATSHIGNVGNAFIGNDAGSIGFVNNGNVFNNNGVVATIQTFTSGDTVCVACDLVNNKVWFRTNGGNWNNAAIGSQDPANNIGGISLTNVVNAGSLRPGLNLAYNNDQLTVNLGDTAFAQTAPVGFSAPAPFTLPTVDENGAVANQSASFTTYRAAKGVTPSTPNKISSTRANRSANITNAWYGGIRLWGPAAPPTYASGTVKEGSVLVANKKVWLLDNKTKVLLGTAITDGSGAFAIHALGRVLVDVLAEDPNTFQAQIYDRVTPV
jgi:hypothetical protein